MLRTRHWRFSVVLMLAVALVAAVLVINGSAVAQAATPEELATIELGPLGIGGDGTAGLTGTCNPDGSVALTSTVNFVDPSAGNDTALILNVGTSVVDLGTGSQSGTPHQATVTQPAGPIAYVVLARTPDGSTAGYGSATGTWPQCSTGTTATDAPADTAAPAAEPSTTALAEPVPCEGAWKNFWWGKNSVTGKVTISDKDQRVDERTVTFEVSSTATVPCTVYAQIFTYDGEGDVPQTSVASTTIELQPGETQTVELTTDACRIQADILLNEYETVQWPGMNWDDVIAFETSTCPAPPCQTSDGTEVEPGYAVIDGDHALVRSAANQPEKRAFVVYGLAGPTAPADNNDFATIATTLLAGMDLLGEPVMVDDNNCAEVPVPECRGFAIVEIDATTEPLPRVYLTVTPKLIELLSKSGLDLASLLDIENIDFEAVAEAILSLSEEDLTALGEELFNQPGLAMGFYSVNWFSVEACPEQQDDPPVVDDSSDRADVAGITDTPQVAAAGELPVTGTNTASTVGFALFALLTGLGLVVIARFRRVR